jgi:uncharacterized protein (AIM24 family)
VLKRRRDKANQRSVVKAHVDSSTQATTPALLQRATESGKVLHLHLNRSCYIVCQCMSVLFAMALMMIGITA